MLIVAYAFIVVAAVVPIYVGSFKSLNKVDNESISQQDALYFPLMGSGVLFGLYLLFKYLDPAWVNYLLTFYFAAIGCVAMTKMFGDGMSYQLQLFEQKFNPAALVVAVGVTAYYVMTKNWIASNLFGWAFSVGAVQLLDLDDFMTGMLLLSGLFLYDIFWVFGTEVMVSVARKFDAPIKLLFPRDIFAWLQGQEVQFSMLGLGDIVIPGIFIALCLRYDRSRGQGTPYFTATMIAYVVGLVTTIIVMHTFKAAQPALLYLSPACIGAVLITAAVKGEIPQLFAYKSTASIKAAEDKKAKTK